MENYVIQKLEIEKGLPWVDVKGCTDLEEAIESLDRFSWNNPVYMYRLVKVLATTKIVSEK